MTRQERIDAILDEMALVMTTRRDTGVLILSTIKRALQDMIYRPSRILIRDDVARSILHWPKHSRIGGVPLVVDEHLMGPYRFDFG